MSGECDPYRESIINRCLEKIYSQGSTSDVIMQQLMNSIDIRMMKRIIDEFQFDVNHKNNQLIMWHCHNRKIVNMLLDYGANPRARNDSIFLLICKHGDHDLIVRFLEMGVPVNGGRALFNAVHRQTYETIKLILDNGTDINSIESKKALLQAAKRGDPKIFRLLLDYGVDPDIFNESINVDDENQTYVEIANILLSYNVQHESIFKHLAAGFSLAQWRS